MADCLEAKNLKEELHRVLSFPLCPWGPGFHPRSTLAREGFYWSESGDSECAFCHVTVTSLEHPLEHAGGCTMRRENTPLTDTANLKFERNRLLSFWLSETQWSGPVDPRDLARSGFHFTGPEDTARCHFCRLEVKDWEKGDSADGEHRKWNPDCPFLLGRPVGNVPIGQEESAGNQLTNDKVLLSNMEKFNAVKTMGKEDTKTSAPNQNQPLLTLTSDFEVTSPPTSDLEVTSPLTSDAEAPLACDREVSSATRYPKFSTAASRLSTFSVWPLLLQHLVTPLVQAGFFYTGKGDRVLCFLCGVGLKDWAAEDSPVSQHRRCAPHCAFLRTQLPRTDVKTTTALKADFSKSQEKTTIPPQTNKSGIEVRPRSNAHRDNNLLCRMCGTGELGAVFLPCGHLASCVQCVTRGLENKQALTCPLCDSKFTAYVKTFFPVNGVRK